MLSCILAFEKPTIASFNVNVSGKRFNPDGVIEVGNGLVVKNFFIQCGSPVAESFVALGVNFNSLIEVRNGGVILPLIKIHGASVIVSLSILWINLNSMTEI